MALGGGIFVTQNKVLPGSYINVVSATSVNATLGERGIVAIALPIGKAEGTVIEVNRPQFANECMNILGKEYSSEDVAALREIFRNANKVYLYDLGAESTKTVSDAVKELESYDFNILCAYTSTAEDVATYISTIKTWRDDVGKKCQLVVFNQSEVNYEGIINVVSTVSDEDAPDHALVAWVAGAEAGCAINASCTNKIYDGEYTIVMGKTQYELETCITNGEIVFHKVYGDPRLLEDINSLTETTEDKGEDFKSNQTIRVVDQIANDVAKLFNTKYLGKIPNNKSGRASLWGDIVAHHRQLEDLQAIEDFDSSLLTVEQGNNKKRVVINDVVTPVNAMAQLYTSIVIQ